MKRSIILLLACCTLFASSWTLLRPQFFFLHDYVHAARFGEMLLGLQEGQLPVRWSSNFGYGYGMPLFEFYAPFPYFLGALFLWAGLGVVPTLKLVFFLPSIVAFFGMFLFARKMYGSVGGVVSAVLFTLAPYRAVNLYVRGALSEAWGMSVLPLTLLGILMVIKKEKYGSVVLYLGLVLLILSHNLTTLLFVPISLLLGAVLLFQYARPTERVRRIGRLAFVYVLAIGSCMFYLLPAVVEKDLTKIGSIFSGYFHYSNHFLYIRQFLQPAWKYGGSAWGPDDGLSFFFGYAQWAGLALFVAVGVWKKLKVWRAKGMGGVSDLVQTFLWSGTLVLVTTALLFLSLQRSTVVWDIVGILQMLQFPWRTLSVASFLIALLVGAAIAFLPSKKLRAASGVFLIVLSLTTSWSYFRPEKYLEDSSALYYTSPERIRTEMSAILPDYIPATMSETLPPKSKEFLVPDGVEKHVEVIVNRGHEKLYKTSFISQIPFNPLIASYPGWVVEIDGTPTPWNSSGQYGTILVDVPAGEHLIGVTFQRTPVRRLADVISVIAISFTIGSAVYVSSNRH